MRRASTAWFVVALYALCVTTSVLDVECCAHDASHNESHHSGLERPVTAFHALKHAFAQCGLPGEETLCPSVYCCRVGTLPETAALDSQSPSRRDRVKPAQGQPLTLTLPTATDTISGKPLSHRQMLGLPSLADSSLQSIRAVVLLI
ncbi:MAG: hypothetical protein AB1646_03220 [Thermodesulfobacteriota bacterium]